MVPEIVSEYIRRHSLLRKGAPVIVALSGGADSVALLSVLVELGYECVAAHCNFHLRGDESMRDMRHAVAVADVLEVEISVCDFDVDARRRDTDESVEMACRALRYDWFGKLADRNGAQAIAVGHHREDRAETFFLNLMRGAGIHGLTSMRARNGDVVRPLLCVTRAQIEDYLRARGLTWVDDSTNASCDYRRNALRNIVFPALTDHFGTPVDAVNESMEHLEQARMIYLDAVAAGLGRCRVSDNEYNLGLLCEEKCAATILLEALAPYGFTYGQVCDILREPAASGRTFIAKGGNYIAGTHRGILKISSKGDDVREDIELSMLRDIKTPVHLRIDRKPVEAFAPVDDASYAFFDAGYVSGGRWSLRHPSRGDRMRVFGSGASVLISKLLKDAEVPAAERGRVWLLCRDGAPVWVPGIRNGNAGTVSPATTEYIELQYISDNYEA